MEESPTVDGELSAEAGTARGGKSYSRRGVVGRGRESPWRKDLQQTGSCRQRQGEPVEERPTADGELSAEAGRARGGKTYRKQGVVGRGRESPWRKVLQ